MISSRTGSITRNAIATLCATWAVALAAVLNLADTAAHAQSATPNMAASALQQVELTDEAARNALRAYLELKTKYEDKAPPGSDAQALAQAMMAMGAISATLSKHGFSDTETWYRTLISFIIAHTAGVEGKMSDMQKSMQALRENTSIPEATKKQLMAQLSALLPSENNLAVAKSVSEDPEFARIIAEVKN